MTERAWKRTERGIASLMGGERVPVNGRGDMPDVLHGRFSIEVKDRALPEWINHAIAQADKGMYVLARDPLAPDLMPLVVVRQPFTQYGNAVAMLRVKHLLGIMNGRERPE